MALRARDIALRTLLQLAPSAGALFDDAAINGRAYRAEEMRLPVRKSLIFMKARFQGLRHAGGASAAGDADTERLHVLRAVEIADQGVLACDAPVGGHAP